MDTVLTTIVLALIFPFVYFAVLIIGFIIFKITRKKTYKIFFSTTTYIAIAIFFPILISPIVISSIDEYNDYDKKFTQEKLFMEQIQTKNSHFKSAKKIKPKKVYYEDRIFPVYMSNIIDMFDSYDYSDNIDEFITKGMDDKFYHYTKNKIYIYNSKDEIPKFKYSLIETFNDALKFTYIKTFYKDNKIIGRTYRIIKKSDYEDFFVSTWYPPVMNGDSDETYKQFGRYFYFNAFRDNASYELYLLLYSYKDAPKKPEKWFDNGKSFGYEYYVINDYEKRKIQKVTFFKNSKQEPKTVLVDRKYFDNFVAYRLDGNFEILLDKKYIKTKKIDFNKKFVEFRDLNGTEFRKKLDKKMYERLKNIDENRSIKLNQ